MNNKPLNNKPSRILLLGVLLLASCSSRSPLERLQQQLSQYPEYSVILQDMRLEGNFFKEYYHQYKIVSGQKSGASEDLVYDTQTSDWSRVSQTEFEKYQKNLGMVLFSKSAKSGLSDAKYPPGYEHVGNPRYGNWRSDNSGNSFWEFYGKYAFMSHMFGMFSRPIYRNDWNSYRQSRSRGAPYFGRGGQYGTQGSLTKHTNKSFFDRRVRREAARRSSFSDRVRQRANRSRMSGVRGRSGGFGK